MSINRKMIENLQEKLKNEKDPLTKKIIELKLAKRQAQNGGKG